MKHYPQPAIHDYKIFERNDIAKYGVMFITYKALDPIQYKSLMYLLWKSLQQTYGRIDCAELSISELCHALGYCSDRNCNFARLKRKIVLLIKELMNETLTIHDKDQDMYVSFVWIQTMSFSFKKDWLTVRFNTDLARYFGYALKEDFTVVKLKYLNRLKKPASVILYPFFCRYQNMHVFNYDISDLTNLLTGDMDFPYKYLKRDHILPAIQEINRCTNLNVTVSENFSDRKVSSLHFVISRFPAEDEMDHYMIHENVMFDELSICPYRNDWMNDFDYDMATQEYIPHQDATASEIDVDYSDSIYADIIDSSYKG